MRTPYTLLMVLVSFLVHSHSYAKSSDITVAEGPDTSMVFTYVDYMSMVLEHHPVMRQADIQLLSGAAEVMKARGGFDPKIASEVRQKYFKDQRYYSGIHGGLKVPTWFGLELAGGYDQNRGEFINPEPFTPADGLWYAGVSIPVGQGLFIDERRAQLRQAQIFQDQTVFQRQLVVNDLVFEAGKTYWDWFMAHHVALVFEEALALAQERFEGVRQSALIGDKPIIDTVEASIQVQNRMLSYQEAQLAIANAQAKLQVFLWLEGYVPLEMDQQSIPIERDELEDLMMDAALYQELDTLVARHPILEGYRLKLDGLDIEQRWKREQLKPILNLKYQPITEDISDGPLGSFSTSDYTWGLEFEFPLLLRKERGSLELTKLKIEGTELDLMNKQAMLQYKAQASLNDWFTTGSQVQLYRNTARDVRTLLEGEQQMFEIGESSLFMVNARETSFINAQVKLIELMAKNRKAMLRFDYELGRLGQP